MSTKHLILHILFSFGILFCNAQSNTLKNANKHFEKFEFKSAAGLYEKVLKKNNSINEAIHNIAFSYYKINDLHNAEKWFAKAVILNDAKPEEFLLYAEILEENNQNEEAKKWFIKYNSLTGKDNIGKRYIESLTHMSDYYEDSANYKISLVKELSSSGSDFSPCYYKNGILYVSERDHDKFSTSEFMWDRSHYLDLYYAEFDNRETPTFKKEHPFNSKLNSKYHEGPVALNKDQNFIVFTRNNFYQNKTQLSKDGINKLKLFYDEYKNGKWQKIQNFPFNSNDYSCGHPALTANGKTMYFVSDMPGSIGGTDIWKSNFENGNWSKPENLGNTINTEGNEMFPILVNDSVFYFSSNGLGGLGGLDIFTMPYNLGKFGALKNIGAPINSNHDDFGLIYNSQNSTGFFTSNRENKEGGSDDIYFFKKQAYTLIVNVIDHNTNKPLPNGAVAYSLNGKKYNLVTNDKGKAKIILNPESTYSFVSSYRCYLDKQMTISSTDNNAKKNLELTIPMIPIVYTVVAVVYDNESKLIIPETQIKIQNPNNSNTTLKAGLTNLKGSISETIQPLNDKFELKLEITLNKKNYLAKTEIFESVFGNEPVITIPLYMDKIAIGTEVGKLIDIKPIYFDLDKALIRSDAAAELDKMVKVMQENPGIVIELGSHTDCRAVAKYNMQLSDKRAKASADYIISKGIDKKRIYGKGYGETQLLNNCACEGANTNNCSEEQHQLNRRTEFKIVKIK